VKKKGRKRRSFMSWNWLLTVFPRGSRWV